MQAPLVSVVLPTFNRLEYLQAAVASVQAQTVTDWELIVVDDGSDEATREFLRALDPHRTRVHFGEHTGVPAAVRNVGISQAKGRYVAFLDSDDRWAADKLELQLAAMEAPSTGRWSYTAFRIIDAGGRVQNGGHFEPWAPHDGSIVEELIRFEASIATPTVMVDTALLREVGGFDPSMSFAEDYDLWLRLALQSEVIVVEKPLVDVRVHLQRLSSDWLSGTEGQQRLFSKMEQFMPNSRLSRLCQKRAGEHALRLAARHARARRWLSLRRSLNDAMQARYWGLRDWLRVVKAVALSRPEEKAAASHDH